MKKLIKTGITGMAGLGAMGAMTKIPGMPAQSAGLVNTVGIGTNLAATGDVVRIGMNVMPKNKKKKGCGCKVVDNIL
jgi:ABC-type sugar transport system ATPase subunit